MSVVNDILTTIAVKSDTTFHDKDGTHFSSDSIDANRFFIVDAKTGLTMSEDTTNTPEAFIIGYKYMNQNAETEIRFSAAQKINIKDIEVYEFRPHTAGRNHKIAIKNYKAKCDEDYAIKVELRNEKIQRFTGFIPLNLYFSIRTSCCKTCEDSCTSGDVNEITKLMVEHINTSKENNSFLKAYGFTTQILTKVTHGVSQNYAANVEISKEDLDILIAYNTNKDEADKVSSYIVLESLPLKINHNYNIHPMYFNLAQTTISSISTLESFSCNATTEVLQEVAYEEGSYPQIKQKEFSDGENSGTPYRQSNLTGLAMDRVEYLSDSSKKYDQLIISYRNESYAAERTYSSQRATTLIAVPTDIPKINMLSFMTLLDKLVNRNQLYAKFNASNSNITVVEPSV